MVARPWLELHAKSFGAVDVILEVRDAEFAYETRRVLGPISLRLNERERLAIVGPSGCGKSTLLSLIAGLITPSRGAVIFGGRKVEAPSHERVILFQDHSLFPWRTAEQNVAFSLRARGFPVERAQFELARFGLTEAADRYPHELSGGMRQRVSLARALASEPKLLLLDEPFAALDFLTRENLLESSQSQLPANLILVTHGIEEALFLADRVLVFSAAPAVILGEFAWAKAKPTTWREMKSSPEFLYLQDSIYRCFKGERPNAHPELALS